MTDFRSADRRPTLSMALFNLFRVGWILSQQVLYPIHKKYFWFCIKLYLISDTCYNQRGCIFCHVFAVVFSSLHCYPEQPRAHSINKGHQTPNADFWLLGATHLHIWKKIKNNSKKFKKSNFFEIKGDQVLYLCTIFPLGNYFHCNLGKKKIITNIKWIILGYGLFQICFFTQDKIKLIS
jgi:hypothetical protein